MKRLYYYGKFACFLIMYMVPPLAQQGAEGGWAEEHNVAQVTEFSKFFASSFNVYIYGQNKSLMHSVDVFFI